MCASSVSLLPSLGVRRAETVAQMIARRVVYTEAVRRAAAPDKRSVGAATDYKRKEQGAVLQQSLLRQRNGASLCAITREEDKRVYVNGVCCNESLCLCLSVCLCL